MSVSPENLSKDQIDLAVLQDALEQFATDISGEELTQLLEAIRHWQNQAPGSAQQLCQLVQSSSSIDQAYGQALQQRKRNYSAQERAKSAVLVADSVGPLNGLGQIANALAKQVETLLTQMSESIASQSCGETTTHQIQTAILQALSQHPLRPQDLAYRLNQPLDQTKALVQSLWRKGYIDQLSAPMLYTVLPGLRDRQYRQQPVSSKLFLSLTSKGYFHLHPPIQWARRGNR